MHTYVMWLAVGFDESRPAFAQGILGIKAALLGSPATHVDSINGTVPPAAGGAKFYSGSPNVTQTKRPQSLSKVSAVCRRFDYADGAGFAGTAKSAGDLLCGVLQAKFRWDSVEIGPPGPDARSWYGGQSPGTRP